MKYLYLFIPVLILGLYLAGCAELESDITKPEDSAGFHKEGILNPMSPNWHGDLIREKNWDMNECRQCHGGNYNGGLVEVSCLKCHNEPAGPENCATCHGSDNNPAPPDDIDGNENSERVGSHQVHLNGGNLGKSVSCASCHIVPAKLYTEGHVDSDLPAEVTMTGYLPSLATNDPSAELYNPGLPLFAPDPEYDFGNKTCANTYCHGYFKNGNLDNSPGWNDPDAAACGTCHGNPTAATLFEKALPGGAHPQIQPPPTGLNCSFCHGGTIDDQMKINPSKHIDGKLNIRRSDGIFEDIKF